MAKNSKKSTRKFEKNQLKDTLERRKAGAKIKQRHQVKLKRQSRKVESSEKAQDESITKASTSKEDQFDKMNIDSFFQGEFKVPDQVSKKMETQPFEKRLGKRKRTKSDAINDKSSNTSEEAQTSSDSENEDETEEDIGMTKDTMNQLAEKDPEFYNYLKENDPETLDFDDNADLAEVDDLSASEEEKPRKKRKKSQTTGDDDALDESSSSSEVTKAMIQKWTTAMIEQNSLRAMRQVVLAFRAAAHINEDDGNQHKYSISNSEVYHELLLTSLKNIPLVLQHHLPIKESQSGKVRVSTDSKKFKTLTPLLKSHSTSIRHLLTTLSDASTLKMTLSSITPLLPYLIPFKKLLKNIIKTVVDIWSDSSNTEATKITAFLILRRLAVIGDPGLREAVLKTIYQGLVKGSRNTTAHTIQGIYLMKNSAAELWGIDASVGYATGFSYIRQLAIHLRNSITNNQKESYKTVYNWQYVHSLDFWSCVLSEHCSPLKEAEIGRQSELRPLIYPTVQITLGALRLIPTSTYFPLRFHLTRSLLRLSRATGTFIPLASPILEVLNSNEMRKSSKASTLRPLEFSMNYKAQKSYLRTRVYQDGIGEQVVELLAEFFVLWSTSIAFPELALPVIVMLKRWLKEVSSKEKGNKNGKVSSMVSLLVQKLDMNSKWIEEKRAKVEFAPNNRAGVDGFLQGFNWELTPLGAFVAGQRKQKEERARLVEEGRREEERKRKNLKTQGNENENDTESVTKDSNASEATDTE